jgi:hypothetical protein
LENTSKTIYKNTRFVFFKGDSFMKLRFFSVVISICLIFAFSNNSRADECAVCSGASRSASLIGTGGIEYLMQQQQENVSPFNADFRVGGLHDSRVGSTSGSKDGDEDTALVARLAAGWQAPLKGDFGLRLDYRGYMDFHKNYNKYNVIDQSLSVEPQYKVSPFILSLPLSYNITFEDGRHDFNRYSVSPTLTYLIPNTKQAVAIYGIGAQIYDKEKNENIDEDGKTLGGGCAYLYYFANKSRVRLSLDYQHTTYDSFVWQYTITTNFSEKRKDDMIMAGLDILFQITEHIGLYIDYAFIHSDSNVDLFGYDRHLVEGGLAIKF